MPNVLVPKEHVKHRGCSAARNRQLTFDVNAWPDIRASSLQCETCVRSADSPVQPCPRACRKVLLRYEGTGSRGQAVRLSALRSCLKPHITANNRTNEGCQMEQLFHFRRYK